MIEFRGKFDESVSNNLNNRVLKKFWWVFALVSVLLIFLCTVTLLIAIDEGEDLFNGIYLISFGVLFFPLVFLLTKIVQKFVNKSMSIMSSDTSETFQFYPDRLIITQKKQAYGAEVSEYESTTSATYAYLYSAEETCDRYFLRISRMQSHVVNKKDLTEGTIEELNEILAENLGQKFKRKKK